MSPSFFVVVDVDIALPPLRRRRSSISRFCSRRSFSDGSSPTGRPPPGKNIESEKISLFFVTTLKKKKKKKEKRGNKYVCIWYDRMMIHENRAREEHEVASIEPRGESKSQKWVKTVPKRMIAFRAREVFSFARFDEFYFFDFSKRRTVKYAKSTLSVIFKARRRRVVMNFSHSSLSLFLSSLRVGIRVLLRVPV